MKVEVIQAWPGAFERIELELPEGCTVGEALDRTPHARDVPVAIFGVRTARDAMLWDGDRIEILRPLQVDPKEARRLRAQSRLKGPGPA